MTPKEQAIEIYNRCYEVAITINNFKEHFGVDYSSPLFKDFIKEYALISVKEIIKDAKDYLHWMPCYSEVCGCKEYWTKVKNEIEQL